MLEDRTETERLLRLYRRVRSRSRKLSTLIHEAQSRSGERMRLRTPRGARKSKLGTRPFAIPELENHLLEEIIEIEQSYREMRGDLGDPTLIDKMGRNSWAEANRLLGEILGTFDRIKDVFRVKIC
ncbi:MAG: hypothetical protein HYT87_19195 [Nitrospirae bacterium]|nr:hypothetical protein [Nitrospirota bacterium]